MEGDYPTRDHAMNYYHESAADRPTDLSIPAEITISKFQLEFEREMVYNPLRKNKARLTNDERAEIMRVLYISNDQYLAELKQLNREERQHMSNVHHRAFKSFFLQGTGLMRKAETLGATGKNPIDVPARRVVMDNAVFYEISVVHHALLHAGREKTWFEIQRTCYGINREEVQWFTTYCKTCLEHAR